MQRDLAEAVGQTPDQLEPPVIAVYLVPVQERDHQPPLGTGPHLVLLERLLPPRAILDLEPPQSILFDIARDGLEHLDIELRVLLAAAHHPQQWQGVNRFLQAGPVPLQIHVWRVVVQVRSLY